jgi:hypothetical protein
MLVINYFGWTSVIRYDPKADILVVKLKEGEMVDERLLDSDVLLGIDEEGEPGMRPGGV